MGKVVLIASHKSDIGKTGICLKTGINLAQSGKKVLLADFSSGKKKMSEYLNVNEDIIYDIKDVLENTCSLNQAVIEVNDKLSLLPCPRISDKLSDIKINAFAGLLNEAKNEYDIIIADADKVFSSYIDFNIVDCVVTVNNNDFSCIKEINFDKNVVQKYNVENIFAVLNKYNRKNAKNGIMMNSKDIKKMTEINMIAVIEENIKYTNIDYDFLFSKEENSFNKATAAIANQIIN